MNVSTIQEFTHLDKSDHFHIFSSTKAIAIGAVMIFVP